MVNVMNNSEHNILLAYRFFERYPNKLDMQYFIRPIKLVKSYASHSLYDDNTFGCIIGTIASVNNCNKMLDQDRTLIYAAHNGTIYNDIYKMVMELYIPEISYDTMSLLASLSHWPEDIQNLYRINSLAALRLAIIHFIPELEGEI